MPEGVTGVGWEKGVAGEGMDGWVERRGSLRSGKVSQGSCKAGRGWRRSDGWGMSTRGSSSVAGRGGRAGVGGCTGEAARRRRDVMDYRESTQQTQQTAD